MILLMRETKRQENLEDKFFVSQNQKISLQNAVKRMNNFTVILNSMLMKSNVVTKLSMRWKHNQTKLIKLMKNLKNISKIKNNKFSNSPNPMSKTHKS